MKKISEFICKYPKTILIVAGILLVPAVLGFLATRINYDILVYLPKDIETMQGEKILADDFKMGSYSTIVVNNHLSAKEVLRLEERIKQIDGVEKAMSIYDVLGTIVPAEILPSEVRNKLYHDDATILFVTFSSGMSDDTTLNAINEIRQMNSALQVGGMSATVLDTKQISDSEVLVYALIAVTLCLVVLMIALDNYLVPFLLILNIGTAIIYNFGSNIIFGEISYITKAISSVLQLGVTMDFSIFLYHKYCEKKAKMSAREAMTMAIRETSRSVFGSSITTIAGFLALCFMTLTLGKDIGLVMAKGVALGVVCVLTVFPALLLCFDKVLAKFKHKVILPKFDRLNHFVVRYDKIIFGLFVVAIIPAYLLSTKTQVYYNLSQSIPADYAGRAANIALEEKFNIISPQIILINKQLPADKIEEMSEKIRQLDGIDAVASYNELSKSGLPDEFIDEDLRAMLKSDQYLLVITNSRYKVATTELNQQINQVNEIVKSYDSQAIVAGEGALTKDLVEISNRDFNNVNIASIGIVFVLMAIVFKSWSLPILLTVAIEFAIFVNMGIPYLSHETIPFVASIVIGTIQLGATIDYAILLTNNYLNERKTKRPKEAITAALSESSQSIYVSALCFFAATVGVGFYSKLSMIAALCGMMARGSLISMAVVLLIVPSLLMIFDKLITKTSKGVYLKETQYE